MNLETIQTLVFGLCSGIIFSWIVSVVYKFFLGLHKKSLAQKEADRIIQRAKSQVARIDRESRNNAKEYEQKLRRNAENDIKQVKKKLEQSLQDTKKQQERSLRDFKLKQEQLDEELKTLESKNKQIEKTREQLQVIERKANLQSEEYQKRLESVAQLSRDEAEKELKDSLEDEVYKKAEKRLSEMEQEMKEKAEGKAKMILATAVARYSAEVATEKTVSIISLTGDDLKGKIIGREGRNIRALEAACGVDLIIDETPGSMVISSFDPIRREIACLTLEKLIEDGRIHPARIEELAFKMKTELEGVIKESGEKACFDLGVHDVHPNIQYSLGTLKYRMSHMNNLYDQSLEMAFLAGLIASEIEFNTDLAKRASLFHAVGRSIDHTIEGSYSDVGADYLKKLGESQVICDSVRVHNKNSDKAKATLDHITQSAFQLTQYRPGVENASKEKYIKRLKDLESIANSFDGVFNCYAIQAGKELRVLVNSEKITEDQSKMLARDIARKIERELNYPGSIKISLLREMRVIEQAR